MESSNSQIASPAVAKPADSPKVEVISDPLATTEITKGPVGAPGSDEAVKTNEAANPDVAIAPTPAAQPGSVGAPVATTAPAPVLSPEAILGQVDEHHAALKMNFLAHDLEFEAVEVPPEVIPPTLSPRNGRWRGIVAAIAILTLALAGSAFGVLNYRNVTKKAVVVHPAKPVPAPSPAPLVAPTPPPPVAKPAPVPAPPQTVTAPAATPTAEHPQAVKVQSKSGLWLRSSPTSADRSNIIGWIPDGGKVSVDQTGDFWWHGTYNGTTGYFASHYTQ